MEAFFKVVGLKVRAGENIILKGVDLFVNRGEVHAIMGPNGSGKTTLSNVIMGSRKYDLEGGDIIFKGESVLGLTPDERAKRGIFLAFQHPEEIQGVSFINFLRLAYNAINSYRMGDRFTPPKPLEFRNLVRSKMAILEMEDAFLTRYLNEGFSGGEKKRAEVLQMLVLEPELVIMDEVDSGLDVDALRVVSKGILEMRNKNNAFVIITHYSRILKYIRPDYVHILVDGRIAMTGDYSLSDKVEEMGYDWVLKEVSSDI